jgi:hypothetical protein
MGYCLPYSFLASSEQPGGSLISLVLLGEAHCQLRDKRRIRSRSFSSNVRFSFMDSTSGEHDFLVSSAEVGR